MEVIQLTDSTQPSGLGEPSELERSGCKIRRVAFIYVVQETGDYYITDDPGFDVQRRPQLGLQYLCAVLERDGVDTTIIDQTVTAFNVEGLIEQLEGYDIVGFYCSDPQEDIVKDYCVKIKERLDIHTLVGGPSTFKNSSFLEFNCDIVVHGEGEETISELIAYFNGDEELSNIRGISYKQDGQTIATPPRALIPDLDDIPFPDRSKIDVLEYYDYFFFGMKKPYISMIASRGCIFRCSFCTEPKMWGQKKYRQRSVDNVLAELDEVHAKYGVKYVAFQDDIFGIKNSWIEEFCLKLMERPYKIAWMAILHPTSVRKDTERILKLMRQAGCDTLSMGLQTADPTILRNILRHPDEPRNLRNILKYANKFRFVSSVGFIFGLPGDTRESIQTTIDYSIDCGTTLANYYTLSVLRGSEIHETYDGAAVCELTKAEIDGLAVDASKKFYRDPRKILAIASHVARHPGWVARVIPKLPSILSRIGFLNTKDTSANPREDIFGVRSC